MEPLQPKEGYFDRKECFMLGDKEVHYRRVLPRKAKTWMALDMAEMGLVFDEDAGLVYEGYTSELILVVLMVKYYTDLDVSAYEGEEGWYQLYDLLESHGVLDQLYLELAADLGLVKEVYRQIKKAATKTFEKKHSLDYLMSKSFGSLLGTEDIMTSVAQAEGVNTRMIDLLEAFQQRESPKRMVDGNSLLKFSKRKQ